MCYTWFKGPHHLFGGKGEGPRGSKGSEAYVILGFRVPTTSVGARGEGVRGKGEQGICFTRF